MLEICLKKVHQTEEINKWIPSPLVMSEEITRVGHI